MVVFGVTGLVCRVVCPLGILEMLSTRIYLASLRYELEIHYACENADDPGFFSSDFSAVKFAALNCFELFVDAESRSRSVVYIRTFSAFLHLRHVDNR